MTRLNSVARNTLHMTAAQGVRAVVQIVFFLLLARVLGVATYGAFVGVTALVGLVAPFATWGGGNILVRKVSSARGAFPMLWGDALITTFVSGLFLMLIVTPVCLLVLPAVITWQTVVLVAVGDLVFSRISDLSGQAFQAHERLLRTGQFLVLTTILRLVAVAVVFISRTEISLRDWALLYALTAALAAVYALHRVARDLGPPDLTLRKGFANIREGTLFSVGLSAQALYNDVDKTMLASLDSLSSVGIYAAAYRAVDASFTPIRGLLFSTYTHFFRTGQKYGIASGLKLTRRLMPASLIYAALASTALYGTAPYAADLLGDGFAETSTALRWLAVVPVLRTVHSLAADALTGAGRQGSRTSIQVFVAAVNVVTNLVLIPTYSWRGAVAATLISETLLVLLLWTTLLRYVRHSSVAST